MFPIDVGNSWPRDATDPARGGLVLDRAASRDTGVAPRIAHGLDGPGVGPLGGGGAPSQVPAWQRQRRADGGLPRARRFSRPWSGAPNTSGCRNRRRSATPRSDSRPPRQSVIKGFGDAECEAGKLLRAIKRDRPEEVRYLALLKAALIGADVAGSIRRHGGRTMVEWMGEAFANVPTVDDLDGVVKARLRRGSLRGFQRNVGAATERVVFVQAGCGSGKTRPPITGRPEPPSGWAAICESTSVIRPRNRQRRLSRLPQGRRPAQGIDPRPSRGGYEVARLGR